MAEDSKKSLKELQDEELREELLARRQARFERNQAECTQFNQHQQNPLRCQQQRDAVSYH